MPGHQGIKGTPKKQPAADQASFIGKSLHQGEYIIEATIGRGGMGQVFLASHRTLDVPVAIKQARADQPLPESVRAELDSILSQEPGKSPARPGQATFDFPLSGGANTDRFLREALLLARLHHPAIPTLYDYFLEDGYWYLVMEYVPGPTLASYIRQYAPLPPLEALNYAMQLCDVLDYLQKQAPPVVFRDLKPSNIILSPEGRLMLIDFGIARYFKEGQINDTTDFGSPGYASPEQYEGNGQTDGRSDIYSLGVILHEMLSGKRPARGGARGSQVEALRQINPALSPALCGLVAVATRPEPMYRFQTPHAFYLALERTRAIEERRTYHRHAVLADDPAAGSPSAPVVPAAPPPPANRSNQDHLAPAAPATAPVMPAGSPHSQHFSPRAPTRTPLPQRDRKNLEQEALAMQLASLEDSLKQRIAAMPTPLSPVASLTIADDRHGKGGNTAARRKLMRRFLQISILMLFLFAAALTSFFALSYYTHQAKHTPPQQQPTLTRPSSIASQTPWQVLPSMPSPQADNTASYIDLQGKAYVYVSGGFRGATVSPLYARGLYRYDIAAARWESLNVAGLPTMGNNTAAVDEHQRIFFTAGYSADVHAVVSALYIYDPQQNTLHKIAAPSRVHLGFGSTMIADQQGHLYITQGFTAPGNPRALAGTGWYRYDIATGQWDVLAMLPVGTGYTLLAPNGHGGILMIGGSRDAGQSIPITQVYRYNIPQNTWTLEPSTTPTDISGAASCLDGQGHLVIIGGYDAQHAVILSTAWQVTLSTLAWQPLPTLPSSGSLLGAAACDGNGHVFLERGASTGGTPTADFLDLTQQG